MNDVKPGDILQATDLYNGVPLSEYQGGNFVGKVCRTPNVYKRKQEYVLGFFFTAGKKCVVLINKNKPEFQAGKLNGVGGKIEPTDESPAAAMTREFEEETGKRVESWRRFAIMEFAGATVHCFCAFGSALGLRLGPNSPTDEQVNVFFVDWSYMSTPIMQNVLWLVPMALTEDVYCPIIRFD